MARQPAVRSDASGRLSYQPAPDDRLVPNTLEFIRTQLPGWRDDPKRPQDTSEKRLNSSLCDFLDSRSRFDFPMVRFKHEALQTKSRTVDVGVHGTDEITSVGTHGYTIYEPFMVIEAKRLPAPSSDREREYVTGKDDESGGIQRFKLGLHGAQVETAAIVGYVEKHSVLHWHATINNWIADLTSSTSRDGCVWSQADALGDLACNEHGTSAAESNHQRSDACLTKAIKLHHFWIVISSGNKHGK